MCDINTLTKLKTKTIFKVVYKVIVKEEIKYMSPFAKCILKLGKASELTGGKLDIVVIRNSFSIIIRPKNSIYNVYDVCYNKNMIGRVSGFKRLTDATIAFHNFKGTDYPITIIKIVLTGIIMKGTAANTGLFENDDKIITYAGSIIKSMEEVKCSNQ